MRPQGAKKTHRIGAPNGGRLALLLIMALFAVSLLGATGATVAFAGPDTGLTGLTSGAPSPPLILPDEAGVSSTAPATRSRCNGCSRWIVGGSPGVPTRRIAALHGARAVDARLGIYRIVRQDATGFARGLRRAGLLVFAEPDLPVRPASYPGDALAEQQGWLEQIVNTADTTPPRVSKTSPVIGLVEQGIDPSLPDLARANLTGATRTGDPALDNHGGAIAAIIGSPGEKAGIRGVWPGARMQHFPAGATCSTAAGAAIDAVRAGVSVINMSYTMPRCYTHYLATQYAISRNVLPVAAAGNTGHQGNAVQWPAADPHVISVGAVDSKNRIADFSTRNRFVSLSAPGVEVLAPWSTVGLPDSIGAASTKGSWALVNGTSFSAPMVSATAAWLRQVHPRYSPSQITQVLTSSAQDLGQPGRDPLYGAGLLDIDAALTVPRPINDPLEPNDDIPLLKGSGEIAKAGFLWQPRGRRVVKLTATLSRSKDPADVYRIRIPARKKILITAAQLEGDIKVTALKPSTKTLRKIRKKVIVKSDKPAPKTEGIEVGNLWKKPQNIWLAITPGRRDRSDQAAYRLTVRRTR